MFDCCWFRGNQPQPGMRASPLLPTLLFPSPLLRAGLSPPSAEPPENGQRGSQHSPGMEETAKSAKRRGRRRGGRSDRGPPPTKGIHMPRADQGNTAPPPLHPSSRHPSAQSPSNCHPRQKSYFIGAWRQRSDVGQEGVTFRCHLSLMGTEATSVGDTG